MYKLELVRKNPKVQFIEIRELGSLEFRIGPRRLGVKRLVV